MQPKIISIIGARPQFIKHAPVSLALARQFQSISIHTGQHYDEKMSDVFFNELKIPRPEYLLDIGKASLHGAQTGLMLQQIEEILIREKPAAVLVYGDTNSTLAGALAASKLHIPIIHIEAGLRSFNRGMPEEVNRVLTDHISELLFAPTPLAIDNLAKEGITKGVHRTGDVMCDTLNLMRPFLKRLQEGEYYFATLHRPYNTDEQQRLTKILDVMNALPAPVVFPIHPRTANNLRKWGVDTERFSNIRFVDPVGYEACLSYQSGASYVITDSGGIQKEAYMLQVPCITVRSETEWVETLEGGCNTLVFDNLDEIAELVKQRREIRFKDLYGDGHAADEITGIIARHFNIA
ncbi:MAG: UDP-N-acetylglucosamine 2-epimerase (non-hydrolyzing) [Chitinophagaceae bacterium]|nr:MAG: UDP-N-acetylglucosamine 2-epimerase (non-hydrolyzing) [Chitinophagaceae bacterium]